MPLQVLLATSSFGEYGPEALDFLKAAGVEPVMNPLRRTLSAAEVVDLARGFPAVLAGTEPYTREVLEKLPALKVISRCGSGTDNVDLDAARARGISVASTPSGPTRAVAELTLAFILALLRNVRASDAAVRAGRWKKPMGFLLEEMTFGLLGLGRIGRTVAELLRGLGAPVVGYDVAPDAAWAKKAGVLLKGRDEVIEGSDVLCLHLPMDEGLRHLINASTLARMREGSFLVNTSRGALVDEAALASALASGRLRGAALDVFEREPYDGPLRGVESVILSPHVGSYARAGRVRMEMESAENVVRELRRLGLLRG